jgi:hypothetical protein
LDGAERLKEVILAFTVKRYVSMVFFDSGRGAGVP